MGKIYKIKCMHCEKIVKAKVISNWNRTTKAKDYSDPKYFLDDDGDGLDERYPKRKVIIYYKRLLVFTHNRGILKRHKCDGSNKKKIIKNSIMKY